MRLTTQMKFQKTVSDYQYGMSQIKKYNDQLSEGIKISQPYQDAAMYDDGMRLEYEITTIDQVIEATNKSTNFAKNSDQALIEFTKQLERFKVKLAQAASDVHDITSLTAIAKDLEGIKDHLKNIANTSINGQYLFSGSTVDIKPINGSDEYLGNDEKMKTASGSNIEIPFNITGKELFKGTDRDYRKLLTTNVSLVDNTKKDVKENPKFLNEENRIADMIGVNYIREQDRHTLNLDYDFLPESDKPVEQRENKYPNTFFYLQGRRPDGTSFTSKFQMTYDTTIGALMEKIGIEFGNSATDKVVDVSINNDGQFNVQDITRGNQVIDFHLVAATEQLGVEGDVTAKQRSAQTVLDDERFYKAQPAGSNGGKRSPADQDTLAELERETNARVGTNNEIHITHFTKNNFKDVNGNKVNSYDFDRVRFEKKDNKITGNISQVIRSNGEYAKEDTPISMVAASKTTYPFPNNNKFNIDNGSIKVNVVSRSNKRYEVNINFTNNGARFSYVQLNNNGTIIQNTQRNNFTIYQSDEFHYQKDQNGNKIYTGSMTPNKDMTYRQLNDIIAMAASDRIENLEPNNYASYAENISRAKDMVETKLNDRGQITLIDKTNSVTPIELSVFDGSQNAGRFNTDSTDPNGQGAGSIFSFMENNAIPIDEPSVDIFKDLQNMIDSVYHGYYRAGSEHADPRNTGMQGALKKIDHIMDHINKQKTTIGSYTNSLEDTQQRAEIMKVNVQTVKSNIIDTDFGEAYLSLMQHMMSYQATLQASSRINQLSLLNYL